MKNRVAQATFLLFLLAAMPALAQNEIFLTLDPGNGQPTVVAEPSNAAVVIVRSIDYSGGGQPEPFMLRFDYAFNGMYDVPGQGQNWTTPTLTANGIVFQSSPAVYNPGNIPVQEIRIKLKNNVAHPIEGYKYDVLMGGGVLDPRIRPR